MRHPDEVAAIPIAIIGMACRLPGADNLDEFWKMLVEGRSSVRELGPDRLDQELYFDPNVGVRGKTYSKLASVCSSRKFDQQACPIPDQMVRSADNVHLLMCETAANALRNAGLDPFNVKDKNTGVYIGHAQGSDLAGDFTYGTYVEEAAQFLREVEGFQALDAQTQEEICQAVVADVRERTPFMSEDAPDAAANLVAGTISKAFGFTGPFAALNSACASSLHAILIGARALQLGRIDMAVVGGASDCKSDSLVLFSNARAMSKTGTRPFDDEADGLVIAEGYVAIVMKTLERAIADGDPIQAVVRGAGISSDGKGKSLWAPRKEGQIKAMERAYRAGVDMSSLQYLEAHATATQLGDATELNTLSEVLEDKIEPGRKIPVTSLKANIGHALETAGAAGLVKAVLAIQNATIPPAINIKKLNPKIDWDNVPLYVPTAATPWPAPADGKPRCAGVNAFGIGGLNMHVVIEEFNESSKRLVAQSPKSAPAMTTAQDEAIAIVGMGCVLPGALNIQSYWDLLVSGRNPKRPVPDGRWRTDLAYRRGSSEAYHSAATIGGFITDFEYDWRKHKVPPKQVAQADPLQFMLLDAADQAMADAGYDTRPFDRQRVGVVVGTEFGGDFAFQLQMGLRLPELERSIVRLCAARGLGHEQCTAIAADFSETLIKKWPALVDETGSFSTSSLASRISKSWNLMGGAVAVDGGSASSMSALSVGVDGLLAGDCDMIICAAGQRRLGLPTYEAMSINGVLAEDHTDRSPLDAAARGYFPGEGVGVVLLKRLSDAQRDGDKIRGIIRGIGAAHSEDRVDALRLAVDRSLNISSVAAQDISLLETDSSGLPETDDEILRATTTALGSSDRKQPLSVSTAIGQLGHTFGASGMVSLIKACLELDHAHVPATFGFDSPMSSLASTALVQVPKQAAIIGDASNAGRRLAGINSISRKLTFHTIVQHGSQVYESSAAAEPATASAPRVAVTADYRICRIGAASHEQLISQLNQAQTETPQRFASADTRRFVPADRFRLAIVADSAAALATKLKIAARQLALPSARPLLQRQGIFYRQLGAQTPRVAMLFAGQGSQYHGMLRELIEHVPAAHAAMLEADQAMTRLGLATFAQAAWDEPTRLGKDVWTTQAAMLMADWIMFAALGARGIHPDLVAGHSFGEYAALLACGAWNFSDAVRVTRARCAGIDAVAHAHGGMLATDATPEILDRLLPTIDAPLYLANHNAPDQAVVGGSSAGLDQLVVVLERNSHQARRLPVPCPFHTPLMKDATGPMTEALAVARLHVPNTQMWSVATNRPVGSPDEIRANLVAHMTTPVRYVDLISTIASQQDTIFIEVGPQESLTRMHHKILEGRDVAAISSDVRKRPALEQLSNVQALLECAGVGENKVDQPTVPGTPATPARAAGEIIEFDATQRRRDRMRRAAQGQTTTARPAPAVAAQPASPQPTTTTATPDPTSPVPTSPVAAPVQVAPTTPGPAPPIVEAAKPSPEAETAVDSSQLETFLINFVVEQTGYPTEVVELDADLEADLGIDSIKKAQLFGELQEYFDITPTDDLTLDDFPTLRHVLNFLAGAPSTGVVAESTVAVAEPPLAAAPVVSPVAPVPATTSADSSQLETFLINFVVEQTGYPPEVIELDADLEADLGIDSIKKAQLFGELQEYFDITPTDDLTLDDFPTLRHVLNFLAGAPSTGVVAESAVAVAEPALAAAPVVSAVAPVPATTSADSSQLETFLINFVVEQTGYPPEVIELDADLEADLGIDSIKKAQLFGELQEYFDITPTDDLTLDDFPTLRHVLNFLAGAPSTGVVAESAVVVAEPTLAAAPVVSAVAPLPATTSADSSQLETFLINFVVEQTGYPPEVIELDADLEADLGIDSIKKAQLFGELQEYFDITPTDDLTLDDFPTLRHVLDFLAGAPSTGVVAEPVPAAPVSTVASMAPAGVSPAGSNGNAYALATPQPAAAPVTTAAPEPDNSAYKLGREHGLRNRSQIIEALRQYADLPEAELGDTLDSTGGNRDPRSLFEHSESEQLRGIADAVAVPLGNITAYRLRHGRLLPPADGLGIEDIPTTTDGSPPYDMDNADTASVMSQRYTMRMVEIPLPSDSPAMPTWTGPALVIGDNPAATALRKRLAGYGVKVQNLSITDDLDETLGRFEQLWRTDPTTHLFLASARDQNPTSPYDDEGWQQRRYRGVTLPFFLCQRWVQLASEAKLLDKCSLVGLASLGGDCGFSGYVETVDSGAITALMKSIYVEFHIMQGIKGMKVMAIDAPAGQPVDQLADNICRELASDTTDYEIAYVGNSRRLQNGIPKPAEVQQFADLRPGGVWVVTGGARGITAACALELGRRFNLRLHLLGTSPEPDVDPGWRNLSEEQTKQLKTSVMREANQRKENMEDAWRRIEKAIEIDACLRKYQQANVRATYHRCDVSDQTSLAAVLDLIRTTDGPIEGVLHGAGMDVSCRFQKKQRGTVDATIGSKADGARNLMTLTRDDPVGHFIGFGSVSGRLGSNGQTDYCVASDLLAKLIIWYRAERPACRVACMHWHPWADIGMAARPATLAALKAGTAPELMPVHEGIRHFIREIYAGVPESEVLITNTEYFQRYYGTTSYTLPDAPPVPAPVKTTPVKTATANTSLPGDPKWDKPPSASERIARRAVLRAFESPLPIDAAATPTFDGPVLILGDNPDALALEQKLAAAGANVKRLVPQVDMQQTIAELESLWAVHPATNLFLMTARDADAVQRLDRTSWQRRKAVGVMLPFLVAQRWFQLLAQRPQPTRRTLVAVTSLGGDLGCKGEIPAPEGGALCGLLKSLYIEGSRSEESMLVVKSIDASVDEKPDALADTVLCELAAVQPDIEVGYRDGRRYVIRSVEQPVEQLPSKDIPRGGTWVVTGGARGITAATVYVLARRYGLKLHLIGHSQAPDPNAPWINATEAQLKAIKKKIVLDAVAAGISPEESWLEVKKGIEIHENLQMFKDAGVEVTYHQCDVSDWDALAGVLDRVRAADGSIDAVIHGAGYAKSTRFQDLDRKYIDRCFDSKVDGAMALMTLTQQDPIKYFIGFGSISGRFGGNGLCDYAAANDMLAKLTGWFRGQRPGCVSTSFHWQSWDEVGMAMIPDSAVGAKGVLKMDFIQPSEGIDHLHQEMLAGLPEGEVLIDDGYFHKKFYPHEVSAQSSPEPSSALPPLIESVAQQASGGITATVRYNPTTDPFLDEHRFKGKPFLPGVSGMETIAQAAQVVAGGCRVVGLRDVHIVNGLAFQSDEPVVTHVAVTQMSAGVECLMTTEQRDRKGRMIQADRPIVRGIAELADAPIAIDAPELTQPPLGWYPSKYADDQLMFHGPKMRCLKECFYQYDGGWGKIVATSPSELAGKRSADGWILPMAVLDACVVVCGSFAFLQFGGAVEVPHQFDRLRWVRQPRAGEVCIVRAFFRGREGRHSEFDFTLYGDAGDVILRADGYRTVIIAQGAV